MLSNHKAILSHSLYGVQFLQKASGRWDQQTSSYCSSDFCPKRAGVLNIVTRVLRWKKGTCQFIETVYCMLNRSCQNISPESRGRKLMLFWLVLPAMTWAGGDVSAALHMCWLPSLWMFWVAGQKQMFISETQQFSSPIMWWDLLWLAQNQQRQLPWYQQLLAMQWDYNYIEFHFN